ncbi:hypothetical protein PF005_g9609 [Phytophthora fragariae]|uniref:Retroviral polymerase SH3-like domain-containing protein n=2 Tax=Phytophthora fragariae TaxID=53985 RepID=A0A6A3YAE2_9STRA|nr:hypothetical protein PF011_g14859 [Phytophthora fragariae]KAE9215003.1 hypothetical protein PF005_g9609 [Phytophthora fragariae]KAE9235666.1 hypothetical protein PF002_g11457 [Phytophthora fragariae]KAE9256185.1 hypothetical protein PF004_g244 [Phytophthora fragariae]
MMEQSGLARSLWPEAMRIAVCSSDVRHIRTFGSLAYVHVPVTPGRRKHNSNAKLGYVLRYAENVVGCKVYFPAEPTAKFASDLRVAEEVVYRDRHEVDEGAIDWSSLNFSTEEKKESDSVDNVATEIISDAASMESETDGDQSLGLEEGENDALQEDELADEVNHVTGVTHTVA